MSADRSRVPAGLAFVVLACAQAALQSCAADAGDAQKGEADGRAPTVDGGLEAAAEDSSMPVPDTGGSPDRHTVDTSTGMDSGQPLETGTSDTGPMDSSGPDVPVTCTGCPLVVQYLAADSNMMANDIKPHFQIQNNGASPENLSALTLRYWYTAQGSTSQAFACDYAPPAFGDCSQVQATFVAMTTAKPKADHYMEISFTSGSIPSGGGTGELQTRFHDTNFAVNFDQTQDYSFNASDTSLTTWTQVTLYVNGTLAFGVEP
jgi:hypothetical protein